MNPCRIWIIVHFYTIKRIAGFIFDGHLPALFFLTINCESRVKIRRKCGKASLDCQACTITENDADIRIFGGNISVNLHLSLYDIDVLRQGRGIRCQIFILRYGSVLANTLPNIPICKLRLCRRTLIRKQRRLIATAHRLLRQRCHGHQTQPEHKRHKHTQYSLLHKLLL